VKKRNPRKTAWTKSFRKARGKEMSVDATFDFEKRRNRPVKYDRELMGTTLRAMQRVGEIKARREKMYFEKRMKDAAKTQIKQSKVELKQGIELLVPAAANKEKVLLNVVETQKVKTSAKNQSAVRQKAAKAAAMDE
jgi:large subunit ribosomal protein L24e